DKRDQIALLTGSMKKSERDSILDRLASGEIELLIGTHALIQDGVEFKSLALAIVDEQHRFGVHQRRLLKTKGLSPHLLVMTATPIPRSLSMTLYGDLDISIVKTMPKGRIPITTKVTWESKRRQVIEFVKKQLESGRQAYVVLPLVEESEKIDLRDAISEHVQLQSDLKEFAVGLIHGKMKADEKEVTMEKFRKGELQVLVSTTVIEVGVDVPNANLILVVHAERFGLSQLHQLRGRVGRGRYKSYCVLMLGKAVSDEARERVMIMEKSSNGFEIADKDLEIRGPGDFLGTRQSGLEGFKMANLVRDIDILVEARRAAQDVIERDVDLKSPENQMLRDELSRVDGRLALVTSG
ncbi:MAG: ATP-dependent DNA helicase RecG, partial [Bdellovibrionales bacterium]|nr:ATP-dependent DNA helicase RecG [Bdellovibrionales bacterium]